MNDQHQLTIAILASVKTLFEYIAAEQPEHCAGISRLLTQQSENLDKGGMHIAAEHLRQIEKTTLSADASLRREALGKLAAEPPQGTA
jgi:hypothetical protein